jgi:glycosyltransferase involved in cell wall biosynthesis
MIETYPEGEYADPVHVVPGHDRGGVALLAQQLADGAGCRLVRESVAGLDELADAREAGEPWHLHFADHHLGATPAEAAARVARWARRGPVSVTLHDVPQAWAQAERIRCYRDVAAVATGWVVSSHHEARLLGMPGGHVIHLPLVLPDLAPVPCRTARRAGDPFSLGVLGWVYPDKGHREVVAAAGRLARAGRAVRVTCLGAVAPGHDDLADELRERSRRAGVDLRVTGFLPERALTDAMRLVDVPVAAHRHVSASGSINSWIAAGRRPVVTDGRYARELAALRPDTLHVVPDAALDEVLDALLTDAGRTWVAPGTPLGPILTDTVRAYRAWWAALAYDGPEPIRPVKPPL